MVLLVNQPFAFIQSVHTHSYTYKPTFYKKYLEIHTYIHNLRSLRSKITSA